MVQHRGFRRGSSVERQREIQRRRYEGVYLTLRQAILRGDFPIGTRLVASVIASQMGVSRTPVRDALSRLETLGLVRRSGRSFAVIGLTPADVDRVALVRARLESTAAEQAARLATPQEFSQLRELAERMDDAARQLDAAGFRILHRDFHTQIIVLSHNEYLRRAWEPIMDLTDVVWEATRPDTARYERAQVEHKEIVRVLRQRNGEAAGEIMTAHVRWGMDLIRNELERRQAKRVDLRQRLEAVSEKEDAIAR